MADKAPKAPMASTTVSARKNVKCRMRRRRRDICARKGLTNAVVRYVGHIQRLEGLLRRVLGAVSSTVLTLITYSMRL